jgi:hypothetical protein
MVAVAGACTVSRPLTYNPAEAEAILRRQAEEAKARPDESQATQDPAPLRPLPLK